MTPAQILLDGANAVGIQPREHFPLALAFLGLAVVVLALATGVFRTRLPRAPLAGLLVLGAVPGLWLVLVERADAPAVRDEAADQVRDAIAAVQAETRWPQTRARVVREDDDILFPIGRYALPSRPPLPDAGVLLELRGPALKADCHHEAATGHVVCGVGP